MSNTFGWSLSVRLLTRTQGDTSISQLKTTTIIKAQTPRGTTSTRILNVSGPKLKEDGVPPSYANGREHWNPTTRIGWKNFETKKWTFCLIRIN